MYFENKIIFYSYMSKFVSSELTAESEFQDLHGVNI